MMEEDKRNALIEYRLKQAHETVSEVELLLDHDKYRAAINRMYYGMFYTLLALGNKYEFATSKHGQLIGWFNKKFINGNIFDRKYGKYLREAFEIRNQSDYDAFIELSEIDMAQRFKRMKEFISVIEKHILEGEKGQVQE
jgi:uncharacterized protein (UPF0332 family)